ncbi:DUF1569 domain-containing protein [Crocinitomicaceae bacterium]|nr:DUF1569 domain-containing protein [Crocinitomicaceae bacterium]
MMFIEPNIEVVLSLLSNLDDSKKPLWGGMSAQRMIEHLSESVKVSNGKLQLELVTTEDKFDRMLAFLDSDKPMAKNIEVSFAGKDVPLRHEEIELAIDELVEEWIDFEELFASEEGLKITHPYYGPLNFEQWQRLHAKHFTHHFEQFGVK